MKALLWRAIYAVVCFGLAIWILPMLIAFFGVPTGGAWPILKACMAGIAILYVLFGPAPPVPF